MLATVLPDVNDETIFSIVAQFLRTYPFGSRSDTHSDYDTRDLAETEDIEGLNDSPEGPSRTIKSLLYYIAEEQAGWSTSELSERGNVIVRSVDIRLAARLLAS